MAPVASALDRAAENHYLLPNTIIGFGPTTIPLAKMQPKLALTSRSGRGQKPLNPLAHSFQFRQPHSLLVPARLDTLPQFFPKSARVHDRFEPDERSRGVVRAHLDVAQRKKTQRQRFDQSRVFDAIKFQFVRAPSEDAVGNANPLGSDLVNAALDEQPLNQDISEGNDRQAKKRDQRASGIGRRNAATSEATQTSPPIRKLPMWTRGDDEPLNKTCSWLVSLIMLLWWINVSQTNTAENRFVACGADAGRPLAAPAKKLLVSTRATA